MRRIDAQTSGAWDEIEEVIEGSQGGRLWHQEDTYKDAQNNELSY